MIHNVRIHASWHPATGEGSLRQTDANPAHIGGIVTIGYDGHFSTTVGIDAPTRFTVSADGYAPLTFTVTPEMTSVDLRPASSHFPGDRRFSATFYYPERSSGVPMNRYIPARRAVYRASGITTPADFLFPVIPLFPTAPAIGGQGAGPGPGAVIPSTTPGAVWGAPIPGSTMPTPSAQQSAPTVNPSAPAVQVPSTPVGQQLPVAAPPVAPAQGGAPMWPYLLMGGAGVAVTVYLMTRKDRR